MQKPAVISSSIVHQNPWYRVRRDELVWPNGKPGQYFVMEIPPSVTVLAIEDEKILVIEQWRYTQGCTSIEVVTGRVNIDEEPTAAAARELEEEGGYVATEIEALGYIHAANGTTNQASHVFLATGLQKTAQRLDDSEHGLTSRWVPLEEWKALIRCGAIHDAETLAAWTLYQERKNDT